MENTQPCPNDLIRLAVACKLLPGRPRTHTVFRWIQKGRLRGWKSGGCWYVSREDVLNFPKQAAVKVDPVEEAAVKARERKKWVKEVLRRRGLA